MEITIPWIEAHLAALRRHERDAAQALGRVQGSIHFCEMLLACLRDAETKGEGADARASHQ